MTAARERSHLVLAALALVLGVLAAVSDAGKPDAQSPSEVAALDLARWIRYEKPGLRVIDVRDAAAFEAFAIPGAEQRTVDELAREPWAPEATVVIYADDEASAARARAVLRSRGVTSALVLRGGVSAWARTISAPVLPARPSPEEAVASRELAEMSRWFGGVPRVGEPGADSARASIARIGRRGC
jgi:rhodanese-related sulfurtransferase